MSTAKRGTTTARMAAAVRSSGRAVVVLGIPSGSRAAKSPTRSLIQFPTRTR